jgi:aminoglycoside 2'-N-acetyltransferase I
VAEVRVFRTEEAPADLLEAARWLCDEAFRDDPDGPFGDDDWVHSLGGWHVVVVDDDGTLLGHAAVVARTLHVAGRPFRTGYVEGVATAPGRQGEGLGTMAMIEVNELLRGHFELGALGTGRWSFYERMGWERWQGPTFVRHPGGTDVRTEEDDEGVMVLRFGPSAAVDPRRPIACEAREGEDW